jgi:hypothetical protein
MQWLAIAVNRGKMPALLGKTGTFGWILVLPVTLEAAGSSPVTLAEASSKDASDPGLISASVDPIDALSTRTTGRGRPPAQR